MTKSIAVIIGALAVLLLGACGSSGSTTPTVPLTEESTPIEDAKDTCASSSSYVSVGDGGATLTIDGEGKDSPGADIVDIACVLMELGVSDAVTARMDNTRALDGVQSGEWDGYTVTWSYHPDNGIDLIIEEN